MGSEGAGCGRDARAPGLPETGEIPALPETGEIPALPETGEIPTLPGCWRRAGHSRFRAAGGGRDARAPGLQAHA